MDVFSQPDGLQLGEEADLVAQNCRATTSLLNALNFI